MGFVTLEKSEKEKLFKRGRVYSMNTAELKQLKEKYIKEQVQLRNHIQALKETGGSKTDIKTANEILLALKTMDTQLSSLIRNAKR